MIEFFPFVAGNNFSLLGLTYPSYNREIFGEFFGWPFGPRTAIEASLPVEGSIRQQIRRWKSSVKREDENFLVEVG